MDSTILRGMLTGNFQAPEGMSPIYKPPVLSEGDASAYYANPFRMQEQIVQQNQAAQQAALLNQMAQRGMLTGYDGSEANSAPLSAETLAFLESETPAARDARMSKVNDIIGYLTPYGKISFLSGLFTQKPAPVVDMSSYSFDPSAAGAGMSSTDANAGAVSVDGVSVGYGGGYG